MRPHRVVVPAPRLDHDLGLCQRIEDLTVEQFVSKFAVKGFNIPVFPRAARFDVSRLGADGGNPFPKCNGNKLRPIV